MKRAGPLPRVTPLPGGKGLARRARIRPRSPRTTAVYRDERVPLVARLLAERPVCEIRWDGGCAGAAVDVDEIVGRGRGGSILDESNLQTACRHCHGAKTRNPAEARLRGLERHAQYRP